MLIGLIIAVVMLIAAVAVLISLLWDGHRDRIRNTGKLIILKGGKNINPDAVVDGDGIIRRDLSNEATVFQKMRR